MKSIKKIKFKMLISSKKIINPDFLNDLYIVLDTIVKPHNIVENTLLIWKISHLMG